ncbi:MAG: hypothetical protein U0132_16715 [Gemmatimonadaceae bacterium]
MAEPIRTQDHEPAAQPTRPAPADREVPFQNRWQELRALLLDPERRRLRAVEQRLEDPQLNVDQVSRVLPEAVLKRSTSDHDLGVALGPVVGDAIRASVRKDPQPIVDAIFPIIGPAIRRAIATAFAELAQSINTALEHSFTPRGLAWRFEAMRTGKSFGEVVLSHSLVFRVEQLFVIHRESGLLVEHRTAPGVQALAPDLVAAMLTAITDFVRDSFHVSKQEGLDSMGLGDLTVWVEQGPAATVAAVIRGHAPVTYRQTMQRTVEELHRVHGGDLDRSAASGMTFPIRPDVLEPCLVSQLQQSSQGTASRRLALIAAVVAVALGWWLVPRMVRSYRVGNYLDALRSEPGVVVASTGREAGRYLVSGLRDPLARDPATLLAAYRLDSTDVRAHWEPYVALRPEFVAERARRALQPPATVQLAMRADTLSVTGIASQAWRDGMLQLSRAIAGINAVDVNALQDSVHVALQQRADSVRHVVLPFDMGSVTLAPAFDHAFDSLSTQLGRLIADATSHGIPVDVQVRGAADSVGTAAVNAGLRLGRANAIRARLMGAGIRPATLTAIADSTATARQTQIVVTIRPER